ncbi:internal scaffolding protein [Microviridae sp.]|nr:internal scaffolding protein [Microviridae sp.]
MDRRASRPMGTRKPRKNQSVHGTKRNETMSMLGTKQPESYEDGRTKQSFKDETDVNLIIQKHTRMGTLSHLEQWGGQYGDLSDFDFQEAQNQLAKANSMFEQLPSSVRNKFSNDPERFFEFVNAEENRDRLAEELPELAKPGTRPLPTAKDVIDPETAPEEPPEET